MKPKPNTKSLIVELNKPLILKNIVLDTYIPPKGCLQKYTYIQRIIALSMASKFNLAHLLTNFAECVDEEGKIQIANYVHGFEELEEFLKLLGTVFGWFSKELLVPLAELRQLWSSEDTHYQDVRSMLQYEVESKLIKPKASDSDTGTRSLLRLHRALELIIAFVRGLQNLEMDERCSGVAKKAYKDTLANFHPWLVQKAALLLLNLLPTKAGLIKEICGDDQKKIKSTLKTLPKVVEAMQNVYQKTEEVYLEFGLLNLP